MISRIAAFHPGDLGLIPNGVRDFNLYSGIDCVFFVSVLFCVSSGGGTDILLTTDSGRSVLLYLSRVLVHSL